MRNDQSGMIDIGLLEIGIRNVWCYSLFKPVSRCWSLFKFYIEKRHDTCRFRFWFPFRYHFESHFIESGLYRVQFFIEMDDPVRGQICMYICMHIYMYIYIYIVCSSYGEWLCFSREKVLWKLGLFRERFRIPSNFFQKRPTNSGSLLTLSIYVCGGVVTISMLFNCESFFWKRDLRKEGSFAEGCWFFWNSTNGSNPISLDTAIPRSL